MDRPWLVMGDRSAVSFISIGTTDQPKRSALSGDALAFSRRPAPDAPHPIDLPWYLPGMYLPGMDFSVRP
jgi:hypothetical protein